MLPDGDILSPVSSYNGVEMYMHTNRISGMIILLVGTMMLLSGISPVFAEEEKTTSISIGYQPSTHQMAFMTANQKDWYNESLSPLGISGVKSFSFPTGAPEMQAMLAGDLDFAYVGSAPFVTAVSTGLDAKIIASANIQGSDLVLANDIPYEKPADLNGLKIATFPAGTIQDTILREWLKKNDLNPDTDVEIVAMGPGDATTAILAGKVDAVFLPHPSPVTVEKEGAGRVIVHSGEMEAGHSCCVLVASGDMIRNHPDIVEAVLKIHQKATGYNQDNSEEAAGYMKELTGLETDIIIMSLDEWDGSFEVDPTAIIASVDAFAEQQTELGYLKKPVFESDLFDTSFWKNIAP
jgi:NitT/TauT family transport system substrate-binding protein